MLLCSILNIRSLPCFLLICWCARVGVKRIQSATPCQTHMALYFCCSGKRSVIMMHRVNSYARTSLTDKVMQSKKKASYLQCYLVIITTMASYVFIYKQGEHLILIHSICACYINPNYFQHAGMRDLTPLSLPKIYNQWPLHHSLIYAERYPGISFHIDSSNANKTLAPMQEWLKVHNEYLASTYLLHRLYHDQRLSTNNISEADLCYPSCTAIQSHHSRDANILQFQVKPGTSKFKNNCLTLTSIGIEILMSPCSFSVPYWHSIYHSGKQVDFSLSVRTRLLCYVGGMIRGIGRANVIDALYVQYYKALQEQLFFNYTVPPATQPSGNNQDLHRFFERVWDMYASTVFSWQPEGDTETRRGFYDSWMLACIPVISRSAACTYSARFGGTYLQHPDPPWKT
jgi:hypothetical protein